MTGETIYCRLADLVTAKAGNNKIIKGTQSDRPGAGLVQGFSASGPDVWVTSADYNRPGVILSAVGARCGKTFLAEGSWTSIANTHVLLPSPGVDHRWLWYLTNDESFWIRGGSAQPFVKVKDTLAKEVMVPPLPEQQRIVTLLDEAFDGIATAKVHAEKNLRNARAIFESHLQLVFTQDANDWMEKKLGDESILKIIDGDRGSNYPSKDDFSDDGFCLFLNTKNVRPDGFNFDTTMFISEDKDKALRKGKLQRSDVILTTRGTIGNVAIYDEDVDFENIRINSGMLIFRPNTKALLPSFLFEVFRSGIMRSQMEMHVSGAAQPQLPIKTLVNFEIPIPKTLEAQRDIVSSVREIDVETQHLEAIYRQKLTALDELKKSLLHRAFNGDL